MVLALAGRVLKGPNAISEPVVEHARVLIATGVAEFSFAVDHILAEFPRV